MHVHLDTFQKDWLLTGAFHHPTLLSYDTKFFDKNKRFIIAPAASTSIYGQEVIVVEKGLDKAKTALLLIVLLVLSPGLGLIVGTVTHNSEVGVAVSAGVFALASFLQGLAAWFQA